MWSLAHFHTLAQGFAFESIAAPTWDATGRSACAQIDGRVIGTGERGPICQALQEHYTAAMGVQAERGRLCLDDN